MSGTDAGRRLGGTLDQRNQYAFRPGIQGLPKGADGCIGEANDRRYGTRNSTEHDLQAAAIPQAVLQVEHDGAGLGRQGKFDEGWRADREPEGTKALLLPKGCLETRIFHPAQALLPSPLLAMNLRPHRQLFQA
jgi:hypothetical protein